MEEWEGLEEKYEELGQDIEKLKKQKLQEKWTPKQKEKYYFINGAGGVDCDLWDNEDADNYRRDYLKIFKTRIEAEEYLDYIKARKEASYEFSKEEWKDDDIEKYHINYDYPTKKFNIFNNYYCKEIGKIYFKTKEDAQKLINNYSKQIKKFEYGIEEE